MLQRRLLLTGCILTVLLGLPREGTAGIVEVILEMSGPKMIGFSADCRLLLTGEWESCKGSPLRAAASAFAEQRPSKVWLSLAGGYYSSIDATVNQVHYSKGEVKMWTFDPMLEFESWSKPKCPEQRVADCKGLKLQIYHGVLGLSYNVLFGDNFDTFSNVGLKIRPFGIVVPMFKSVPLPWTDKEAAIGADFSYDVRVYTRRFTAADFNRVPVESEKNGAETVNAIVLGVRVKIS
jgi:hypothetical protein